MENLQKKNGHIVTRRLDQLAFVRGDFTHQVFGGLLRAFELRGSHALSQQVVYLAVSSPSAAATLYQAYADV